MGNLANWGDNVRVSPIIQCSMVGITKGCSVIIKDKKIPACLHQKLFTDRAHSRLHLLLLESATANEHHL